jgi:CDP-diacylglycerol--serine O-phosphatidyltransferase
MNTFENAAGEVRNHRLRRGVSLLPAVFTVGNMSLGYYAAISTLQATPLGFDLAARAIGIAILFDMLDGRIARATGTNSEFGKQFDSLADVISFGVAPAMLAFTWGFRQFFSTEPGIDRNLYWAGLLATAVFMICSAWRLARFNIQGMAPGHGGAHEMRYFVGMPTPAAAGMIAAMVHAFKDPIQDWRLGVVWAVVVAGLAVLMSSTLRYYAFKDISLRRRRSSVVVVVVAALVWAVVLFSEETLLLVASAYALSGVMMHLWRKYSLRPKPAE